MHLPLFESPKKIEPRFSLDADIVLYCGDVIDFVATIPNDTATLIMTSPPYNLGKDYEYKTSIADYLDFQSKVIKELYRVLKPEGSICWQVGNFVQDGEVYPLDILYYDIFKKLDMRLRNRIVWRFGHGLHASKRFSGRYETILWFTKSNNYIFNLDAVRVPSKYPGKRHFKGPKKGLLSGNPLGKNPSDVWDIIIKDWELAFWDIPNVKSNHPEKTPHPCQYPIALVERCVLALTQNNDWVFDPYAGVGTSLIAAIMHNRRAIGSEKEIEYVQIAQDRLQAYFNGDLGYRPLGKPVHCPTGKEQVAQIPQEWAEYPQKKLLEEPEDYQ